MSYCRTLVRYSLSFTPNQLPCFSSHLSPSSPFRIQLPYLSSNSFGTTLQRGFQPDFPKIQLRCHGSQSASEAVVLDSEEECSEKDTVERLLSANGKDEASSLMKMERRSLSNAGSTGNRFPYLDKYRVGNDAWVNSDEVLEVLDSLISDARKDRLKQVVKNRTYSVCLVVEGLSDPGNCSAAFRSADALGLQSVHVVAYSSKRYRESRYVSMGAEKWLDVEVWDSTRECFDVLRSRGYRIATTHIGPNSVAVDTMDWSVPTAIVVGNESSGISAEALELSDMHCIIPMRGMVDSFNVSVAAGILMHHAVSDRISRLGYHGDLTQMQRQILLAEFSLRHSKSAISLVHEFAKRKEASPLSRL